ncbi:hypothetical protein F2Q70_00017710 [Brassica cretica]|uniref:Uncharacterized protein n=1 Tax=Brassica cretica TaxID=69181 RepID=A0A8S9I5H5_BRACR|nr:hypothetical protein F2Q70_00017710 [Brassica cretica]
MAELSHKLIQATKKKEDAVTEASRLKTSMTELEKKLNKLEIYCHNLKSGLDECSSNNKKQSVPSPELSSRVADSQLRTVGGKVYERLSLLLQSFDVKINSFAKNPEKHDLLPRSDPEQSLLRELRTSKLPGFQKTGRPGF